MSDPRARLAEVGLELPEVPAPAAAYLPYREGCGLIFTAGQLPTAGGELPRTGLVGADLTTEEGAELARSAALNILAVAAAAADGDLGRVRVVKVTVFVASAPDFHEQHLVANGASEFLGEILDDAGRHSRSAVGVASLPLNSPVEIEAIVEIT